jgi:hypothetical protein
MGDVLFIDAAAKANDVDYPVFTITALDPYGKARVLCYGFGEVESQELIRFFLESFRDMVGTHLPVVTAVFSDGIITDTSVVTNVFPSAKALLCCFHIFHLNMPANIRRLPDYDAVMVLCSGMRHARDEEEFDKFAEDLRLRFPLAYK